MQLSVIARPDRAVANIFGRPVLTPRISRTYSLL